MTAQARSVGWLVLAVAAAVLLSIAALAQGAPTAEDRIAVLNQSYACPVCDGQAVSESNAPVAATIREFIRTEVARGASDDEIRDSLVARYGGEVLLRPPSDGVSTLLWVLPVVVLVTGGIGAWALFGRRPRSNESGVAPTVGRVWPIAVGGVVIAVGFGLVLAQVAGERGVDGALTGEAATSPRQMVAQCQAMAAGDEGLVPALQCFDEVLATDPTNIEALTYRGWYVVLAASSAEAEGDSAAAAELIDSGLGYLDDAVAIDPSYPDARAFRAVVYSRQERPDEVCAEISELRALDPPEMMLQLTGSIAEQNGC